MAEDTKPIWVGFWRRLIALFLDAVILGVAGLGAGSLAFDYLSSLDGPTRLIGFPVALLYFGFLTSKAGGSATLGMRMLGMRVLSTAGRPIGLVQAMWRSLLLQLPFTMNGLTLQIDDPLWAQVFEIAAITLVFGAGMAQLILLLFNRPSRRLIHDLLSGSIVVRKGTTSIPASRSAAPAVAFGVVALFLAGAVALTLYPVDLVSGWLSGWSKTLAPMQKTQAAVLELPEVVEAGVQDNTTTFMPSNGEAARSSRTLTVTARVRTWPKDPDAEVARVGDVVLKTQKLEPGQNLRIVIRQGYDIGIASGSRAYGNDYPPPVAAAKPAADPADAGAEAPAK